MAEVDQDGTVTAIAAGEAVISATAADGAGATAECRVTVNTVKVTAIELSQSEWTGMVGESFSLTATVIPDNATDRTVVWESSDPAVAAVNRNGKVTAFAVGEATISAVSTDGSGISAECRVTVNPFVINVESVEIEPDFWYGSVGESIVLTAHVYPENATNKAVTWSYITWDQDDVVEMVISGNSCTVTAKAAGEVKIFAESEDAVNVFGICKCKIEAADNVATVDEGELTDVYTLDGLLLRTNCTDEELHKLTPGTYILRTGSQTIKRVIR